MSRSSLERRAYSVNRKSCLITVECDNCVTSCTTSRQIQVRIEFLQIRGTWYCFQLKSPFLKTPTRTLISRLIPLSLPIIMYPKALQWFWHYFVAFEAATPQKGLKNGADPPETSRLHVDHPWALQLLLATYQFPDQTFMIPRGLRHCNVALSASALSPRSTPHLAWIFQTLCRSFNSTRWSWLLTWIVPLHRFQHSGWTSRPHE